MAGGRYRWTQEPTRGHWVAYYALTLDGDRFRRSNEPDGPIRTALPNEIARKKYPGIERVDWFEIPLGAVSAAAQLKAIVGAAIEMAGGNDAPARDLAAALAVG